MARRALPEAATDFLAKQTAPGPRGRRDVSLFLPVFSLLFVFVRKSSKSSIYRTFGPSALIPLPVFL
jgi:hypothetical protein